jgi:hypothetical protein
VAVFLVVTFWIASGVLNVWFDLDWVDRVYGRLDDPGVVGGGLAAGAVAILLGLWYLTANRQAWREQTNARYFLAVIPLMVLILIEAARAVITGYEGAGGGAGEWPERARFGDIGAGFLVFHATVFSALVVMLAVWLVRRELRRPSSAATRQTT